MQTCGETRPDQTRGTRAAQRFFMSIKSPLQQQPKAWVTQGLVFQWYVHNKFELRRHSKVVTPGWSHAPQSPTLLPQTLTSSITSKWEKRQRSGLRENPGSINPSLYMRSYPSTCSLQHSPLPVRQKDGDVHTDRRGTRTHTHGLFFSILTPLISQT